MSGIEQATAAFDIAIGNGNANPSCSESNTSRPTESMFGNVGELEVDEDSPAEGGGDHLDQPKTPRRERQPVAEADPEGEDEEEVFYEVVVDGVKKEVGLREALDGYIRQETFHTRLNELNDVKQAMRVEAQELIGDRRKYLAKIEELDKHIELLVPKEP